MTSMMKQNPLVSVIVPNYNYAQFLRQRIDSILQQSFTDYELILLDDASTDDSRTILESYRDNPHVSCIVCNDENSASPFAQWQKGLSLARGKYVWIAESDDYADTSFLSEVVPIMEQHPKAVICFTGSLRIDNQGNTLTIDNDYWKRKPSLYKKGGYRVFEGNDYILHNLYWRNYIYNASGVLLKKEALTNVDLSQCIAMHCSGDYLFWANLATRGEVIEIYKKLNRFRYHPTSASTVARKKGIATKEDFRIIKDLEATYPQIGSYRRILRRGLFYKRIKRLDASPTVKEELFTELNNVLGGNKTDFFLERLNHYASFICPFLLTYKRDRL